MSPGALIEPDPHQVKLKMFLLRFGTMSALLWAVSGTEILHKDREGGTIESPLERPSGSFSYTYPGNLHLEYAVKARKGEIVVLTFRSFSLSFAKTDGKPHDYLQVFDGRMSDDDVGIIYTGYLETPFTYISTKRKVRMQFVTAPRKSNFQPHSGFSIDYNFVNPRTHCIKEHLKVKHGYIASCSDEKAGFATECTIQCEYGYEPHGGVVARCVNGAFTQVNCQALELRYCEISLLEVRSNVTSCDQTHGDDRARSCSVECKENYQLTGPSVVTCVDGEFPHSCDLIPEIVRRCENDEENCPYTFDDILDYYSNNQLEADPTLDPSEQEVEQAVLESVPDPGVGAAGRSVGGVGRKCWSSYCSTVWKNNQRYYKYSCGRCRVSSVRMTCFFCRKKKCHATPPYFY
ncbi:unnamed protein product [Clavelina lepadiformis]|uniref:CUB domain-containing protein n=1 Tax=Clavelina lepadiformis TaxID=159417 RepID=A0ABP0FJY3_CLALP